MKKMTIRAKYACPKCGGHEFELGEIYVDGGIIAKLSNIGFRKISSVTCTKCTYTELYKTSKKEVQNILDSIIGK